MVVLFLFAFLSGLVTIAAPCIWPILPLILSATSVGGHKKPLGITIGIIVSFGILTLFLSSLIALIPFNATLLRDVAAVIIALLGASLLVPQFSALLETYVSRFAGKMHIQNTSTGFWSGIGTGLALGVVWTPCAGPILATIAALAATQKISIQLILVTIFYCLGVGIPLFLFATAGRVLFVRSKFVSSYIGRIQQVFGVIMILTAALIAFNYDTLLEAKLLSYFPSYSTFLTSLEGNTAVTQQLNTLKNQKAAQSSVDTSTLFNTDYPAPDFVGITKWLNLANGQAIPSIKSLRGKVVLVDFWTYTCINCIRTLPHVTSWYDKYKDDGFVVIGVHTPEFAFEHDTGNVLQAIKNFNIHYPVAQDNNFATWNNYTNQYWPAEYLIDAQGNVRRTEFGEGEYDQTEKAIQQLLRDSGKVVTTTLENMPDTTPTGTISPETYLGSSRMQYYFPSGTLNNGNQSFTLTDTPPTDSYSLGGNWTIENEDAIAGGNATLVYHFSAGKVYIILRPGQAGETATVQVLLDGKPISSSVAGSDVTNGVLTVTTDRLYNLVDLHGKVEDHLVKLQFQTPGVKAYTFTFG